jgi:type I restriction enzyme S subunit
MERYKEYKDSGVQWIGEIPSHWTLRRIKYVFSELKEKSEEGLETPLSLSKESGIIPFDEKKNKTMESASYVGGKIVHKGEIVFNRFKARLFAVSGYDGIVSSDYAVYKCSKIASSEYMVKLFGTDMYREAFNRKASGIGDGFSRLYSDDLFAMYSIFPPLAEQEKIVNYIESKTSKIDAYIAEKEKEVQLLNELKEAEIAKVVTQGLNLDVKMKDSGISWIGMIPEHWETKRAKFMFFKNKRARRPEDEVITCFRDGQVTLRKNRRVTGFTESEKYDGYQGIRKGDLVIHQMDAFAGSVGVSDSDGMGTSVYHCCTPIGDYNVYYYAYLIRQMALSGFIQSLYKGIRERSSDFSFPVFGNQYLTIPPRIEQDAIVNYINEKCSKINSLVSELESEIDYLKEYKQRLIADCVTGQVNVQNIE